MEIWKDIKDYEGLYQISNYGRVKLLAKKAKCSRRGVSLWIQRKERINECTRKNIYGYNDIGFNIGERHQKFVVHRLVAEAFIPNPENKRTVNHINGIKTDNRVENLEWATYAENMRHAYDIGLSSGRKGIKHHKAKLTDEDVREIRELRLKSTQKELAKVFNISWQNVSKIHQRTIWKHI